ncbi:MAG: YggS family pyridoxal phosphate-dependent enzyme [candidate division WOR-3 bacterium]|nr:YggS family pyridoxal phosphate-dependent enzyme [candidate division WOR-3 bacterium]
MRSVILENLRNLRLRLDSVSAKSKRTISDITLVAVTKNISAELIEMAIDISRQDSDSIPINIIGENRVQEALEKFPKIQRTVEWHLIGHLQTNKVKKTLEIFSMIQSVDSLHLAQEIEKRASFISKEMPVLIEVNTSQEETKFGVKPEELIKLINQILPLKHLKILGLMTLGPGLAIEDKEKSRPCFRLLYELREKVEQEFKIKLPYLSMGMSSDFEVAIEEGSNMIRIGTAIFGPRPIK